MMTDERIAELRTIVEYDDHEDQLRDHLAEALDEIDRLKEEARHVYLATEGEYSDFRIVAVFLNQEAAEQYAHVRNLGKGRYGEETELQEWDTDGTYRLESTATTWRLYAREGSNWEIEYHPDHDQVLYEDIKLVFDGSKGVLCIEARYLDQGKKAMQDRVAKIKAEKAGLT